MKFKIKNLISTSENAITDTSLNRSFDGYLTIRIEEESFTFCSKRPCTEISYEIRASTILAFRLSIDYSANEMVKYATTYKQRYSNVIDISNLLRSIYNIDRDYRDYNVSKYYKRQFYAGSTARGSTIQKLPDKESIVLKINSTFLLSNTM